MLSPSGLYDEAVKTYPDPPAAPPPPIFDDTPPYHPAPPPECVAQPVVAVILAYPPLPNSPDAAPTPYEPIGKSPIPACSCVACDEPPKPLIPPPEFPDFT